MNDYPLVSVVIPFFNAEKFIEEAIGSVFSQTYTNWALLVEDESSNNSTQIAIKYRYVLSIQKN